MKALKKIGSIVLAICLCFSLCNVSAFAVSSPTTTGSITIDGAIANEKYTIYQIFNLTYTDDSYSYKACDGWGAFLETQTVNVDGNPASLFTLTNGGYLSPDSLIFKYADDSDVVAALARAALAWAEDTSNGITGTSVSYSYDGTTATMTPAGVASITNVSTDENGYVTGNLMFDKLSLGYYLVGTSLGSLCMLDSTDPNATISEKNSTPTISKHVYNTSDQKYELEDHESNGSEVTYELDVDHITGAVNLVIHDSQPDELHEDWDYFAPEVTLVDGSKRTKLTVDIDYFIKLTGANSTNGVNCSDDGFNTDKHPCTFEIDFTGYNFSNVSDSAYIEVIYTATLETEGDLYTDDFDEIDNWAVVTFGAASSSPEVEAMVYSFGFEVFKYTTQDAVASEEDNEEGTTWAVYAYLEPGKYYILGDGYDTETYINVQSDKGNEFSKSETISNLYELKNLGENNYINYANYITITEAGTYYFTHTENETINYWNTYPWYFIPESVAQTYAYNVNLNENGVVLAQAGYFATFEETELPLANAVFKVNNVNGQSAYFLEENILDEDGETIIKHIFLFEGWFNDVSEVPEVCVTSVTSSEDGMIYIEGLDTGTYTVTETKAPDGYNMLTSSITVIISATYDEDTGALLTHTVSYTYGDDAGTGVVYVENNSGIELPSTGGIGTTIFYVIGAVLVCGAAVLLITRRRMSREA